MKPSCTYITYADDKQGANPDWMRWRGRLQTLRRWDYNNTSTHLCSRSSNSSQSVWQTDWPQKQCLASVLPSAVFCSPACLWRWTRRQKTQRQTGKESRDKRIQKCLKTCLHVLQREARSFDLLPLLHTRWQHANSEKSQHRCRGKHVTSHPLLSLAAFSCTFLCSPHNLLSPPAPPLTPVSTVHLTHQAYRLCVCVCVHIHTHSCVYRMRCGAFNKNWLILRWHQFVSGASVFFLFFF